MVRCDTDPSLSLTEAERMAGSPGRDPLNGVQPGNDALSLALRHFVYRDLVDAADHLMEDVGWTPITYALAARLRDLNQRFVIWSDEPDLIRLVLDGAPAAI
jgi:hypothetical protein